MSDQPPWQETSFVTRNEFDALCNQMNNRHANDLLQHADILEGLNEVKLGMKEILEFKASLPVISEFIKDLKIVVAWMNAVKGGAAWAGVILVALIGVVWWLFDHFVAKPIMKLLGLS